MFLNFIFLQNFYWNIHETVTYLKLKWCILKPDREPEQLTFSYLVAVPTLKSIDSLTTCWFTKVKCNTVWPSGPEPEQCERSYARVLLTEKTEQKKTEYSWSIYLMLPEH